MSQSSLLIRKEIGFYPTSQALPSIWLSALLYGFQRPLCATATNKPRGKRELQLPGLFFSEEPEFSPGAKELHVFVYLVTPYFHSHYALANVPGSLYVL